MRAFPPLRFGLLSLSTNGERLRGGDAAGDAGLLLGGSGGGGVTGVIVLAGDDAVGGSSTVGCVAVGVEEAARDVFSSWSSNRSYRSV